MFTYSSHSSVLLISGYSECFLILIIINHLLKRWILSHHLVTASYGINFTGIIHVLIHVWTRRFEIIVVMIIECGLSALLGRQSCWLLEECVICPIHLVPILRSMLQHLHSLLQMSLLLNQLLNLH